MQITKVSLNKDAHSARFVVSDVDASFINAIRRSVIDFVPTMAIEDVEFHANSSAMYDEMLAHRLGLLPLTTDASSYSFRTSDEDASPANECTLSLDAKGPCVVTAGMLKSSDPKIVPVYPDTPLVELLEGQQVTIVAKAILGRGKDHAKWASGTAYYQQTADVSVKQSKELEELAVHLPSAVRDEKGAISAKAIKENNVVEAVADLAPHITVTFDERSFDMTVESWGQVAPQDVVVQAAQEISNQLKALKEATPK